MLKKEKRLKEIKTIVKIISVAHICLGKWQKFEEGRIILSVLKGGLEAVPRSCHREGAASRDQSLLETSQWMAMPGDRYKL